MTAAADSPTPTPLSPVRVLHLLDNPYLGGITRHVLTIAEAFAGHQRVSIGVATLPGRTNDESLYRLAEEAGVPVTTVSMNGMFDRGVLPRIRGVVDHEGYDLLHVHGYRAGFVSHAAGLTPRTVHTCHGPIVRPSMRLRVWQGLHLRAMRRAPLTIACSEAVRDWLQSRRVPADRVTVIPNGVLGPEQSNHDEARTDGALRLLYAGRLAPGKGIEWLLGAVKAREDLRLTVVGDGPLRVAVEATAKTAPDRISYEGPVLELAPYYRAADVVVLLSEREGMPLTLIEAAAYGIPVIATNVGGIPEVVLDGQTGILVGRHDRRAFLRALDALSNPAYRDQLGRNARSQWERRHAPCVFAAALEDAYRGALKPEA